MPVAFVIAEASRLNDMQVSSQSLPTGRVMCSWPLGLPVHIGKGRMRPGAVPKTLSAHSFCYRYHCHFHLGHDTQCTSVVGVCKSAFLKSGWGPLYQCAPLCMRRRCMRTWTHDPHQALHLAALTTAAAAATPSPLNPHT